MINLFRYTFSNIFSLPVSKCASIFCFLGSSSPYHESMDESIEFFSNKNQHCPMVNRCKLYLEHHLALPSQSIQLQKIIAGWQCDNVKLLHTFIV